MNKNKIDKCIIRHAFLFLFVLVLSNLKAQFVQLPAPTNWQCPDPTTNSNPPFGSRAMYVDEFMPPLHIFQKTYNTNRVDFNKAILGNDEREDALLFYAQVHDINYLILYDVPRLFNKGAEENDPVREFYIEALNSFIVKAAEKDIAVGLTMGPESTIIEDDFGDELAISSNSKHKVYESEILQLLEGTGFSDYDSLQYTIANTPNANTTINHSLYTLANIYRFNHHLKKQLSTSLKSKYKVGGLKAIVTEYEWWNEADREPSSIGVWNPNDEVTLFEEFVSYCGLIHLFAGKAYGKDIEFHIYQGPMPTVSTRYRPEPELETVADYYNDIEDITTDDDLNFENWIAQLVYFGDRIFLTNHYPPDRMDWLYTSNQINKQLSVFHLAALAKNRENPDREIVTEIAAMFSAETNRYINGGNRARHKGNLWGDLLNRGPESEGESIYKFEKRFADKWQADEYESEYFKYIGSVWFSYSVMPNMIYSFHNPLHSKYKLSSVNKHGITGERFNYFPSNSVATIPLEVHNPDRFIYDESNPDDLGRAGNNYSWLQINPNSETGKFDFNYQDREVIERNQPVLTVYNWNQPRYFAVETIDEVGCKTMSLPVKVVFTENHVFLRDSPEEDDAGIEPYNGEDFYNSPDIWVNQTADGTSEDGLLPGEVINGDTNFVHIEFTNRGDVASSGSELCQLYFAKNTKRDAWPQDWIDSYEGSTVIGDLAGYYAVRIPSIPAYGKTIVSIPWENFPTVDTTLTDSSDQFVADRAYTLMVRVLRSENGANYGMTFQEGTNVYENVRNNNALALKEVIIQNKEADSTVGIRSAQFSTAFQVALFPNPAKEKLQIRISEPKHITILDAFGKPVMADRLIGKSQEIDITPLSSGIYFVNFKEQNIVVKTLRFVKL